MSHRSSESTAESRAEPEHSVLIVGNFLSATVGTRSLCEDLSSRIERLGWTVFTTSRKQGRITRLIDMITTVWNRRHAYAVAQVDVYSGLAFFWAEAVCSVLRFAGKPYVLTLHGGNLPVFARRWPQRVRRLLNSAVKVTAPSPYLLQQMRAYRTDLHLLPNPLDLGEYGFRLRNNPRPHLVWLRAFHSIYNPSLAPRVVSLLVDEFPDVRLLMIGPDKRDGSIQGTQQAALDLGVSNLLELSGPLPKDEVPSRIAQGDIFLNTTNIDNTPVSVLEAMACGLCVVSTNVGGIPYLLEDEVDALLVPPDDPEAMAAAVRRILVEPGLSERLSRNARIKAEQFDWTEILPRWRELLLSVAERREL